MTSVIQGVSYAAGVIAVLLLITAVILLIFVRDRELKTVIINPTPVDVLPTPVPLPKLRLLPPNGETSKFGMNNFPSTLIKPLGPDPAPAAAIKILTNPLVNLPPNYGFAVISNNAALWCSSLDDKYAAFAEYVAGADPGTFVVALDDYPKTDQNRTANPSHFNNYLYYNCLNNRAVSSDNLPELQDDASAFGSLGYRSIAMSYDSKRLYLAYRTSKTGPNAASASFGFGQKVGKVAVYTHPADDEKSSHWVYACDLFLQNPFGSQVALLSPSCSPLSATMMTGDEFGAIIRTSVNRATKNRLTAVRSNFLNDHANGAAICIFEENTGTREQVLSGNLQLLDSYGSFTPAARAGFANDFAISDKVVLAAIREPGNDCAGNQDLSTAHYRLAYFRRNDDLGLWEFKQLIESPAGNTQDFGVSILLSPDASMALIGSPNLPTGNTPGKGGNVYVYTLSADGLTWSQGQVVADPKASENLVGAFGYFLSADPLFLVVSISANQNNSLTAIPETFGENRAANEKPKVVLMAIDGIGHVLDLEKAQVVVQPGDSKDNYLDPLFGCNMAMAFPDGKPKGALHMLLNSPLNRIIELATMNSE